MLALACAESYILARRCDNKKYRQVRDLSRKAKRPDQTPEPFGPARVGGSPRSSSSSTRRRRTALRLPARARRRAEVLGRAEGPVARIRPTSGSRSTSRTTRSSTRTSRALIPPGNYGAGAVIVWDRGRWFAARTTSTRASSRASCCSSCTATSCAASWTLRARRQARQGDDWLLIKKRDAYATQPGTRRLSARLGAVRAARSSELGARRRPRRRASRRAARARREGARAARLGPSSRCSRRRATPFTRADWVFELKYDGYPVARRTKATAARRSYSRAGHDSTERFRTSSAIARAAVSRDLVIDGEVIVIDARGMPSFHKLQQRAQLTRACDDPARGARTARRRYVVVRSARAAATSTCARCRSRAQGGCSRALLPTVGPLRYSEHIAERRRGDVRRGRAARARGRRRASAPTSPYRAARARRIGSRSTPRSPTTSSSCGYRRAKDGATDSARCSSRSSATASSRTPAASAAASAQRDFKAIEPQLEALERAEPPAAASPRSAAPSGSRRVSSCQVKFKQRTPDGSSAPAGLHAAARRQVARAVRQAGRAERRRDEPAGDAPPETDTPTSAEPPRTLDLTNLDKVFWPDDGYTKGDLIEYYRGISRLAAAVPARPPRRADALPGRHRRQVVLPEGRAGLGAADGSALETMWSEHGRARDPTTSCSTTSSRCSTSPTWRRSRCTCGRAASPRSSGPTGASSISTPRARR